MKFNPDIHPDRNAISKLIKEYPKDQPVVMLNILRFRDQALEGTESGKEAYLRYSENAFQHLKKTGAKMLYKGKVFQTLAGRHDNPPHEILLVQYPTVKHFIDMVSTEEYMRISQDRTIALEYGGLVACETEYSMNSSND